MQFYDNGLANGGFSYSKRELHAQIQALYSKIDDENEKRDELLGKLRRTERAITRWKELVEEMEAYLQ